MGQRYEGGVGSGGGFQCGCWLRWGEGGVGREAVGIVCNDSDDGMRDDDAV